MFETVIRSLWTLIMRERVTRPLSFFVLLASTGEYHNNFRNKKTLGQSAAATIRKTTTGHTRGEVGVFFPFFHQIPHVKETITRFPNVWLEYSTTESMPKLTVSTITRRILNIAYMKKIWRFSWN